MAAAKSPEGAVMRDRERFIPFFEAAEQYAYKHELLVGGDTATRLLLGRPPGPEDYFYELYSCRALEDARALTFIFYKLAPEGLGHYANMMTCIPRKEFSINIDERPLFRIKALEVHRGARAADVIVPSIRPASFACGPGKKPLPLRCMGPEIQLMGVYAALSDPARAGEWPSFLNAEERLREMFTNEVRNKIREVGGGAEEEEGPEEFSTSDLKTALAAEYVPRSGHAAVGAYAVSALESKSRNAPKDAALVLRNNGSVARLQLVTSNSFTEEERVVRQIASRFGLNVQYTENELKVPTDARLRRMTMYVLRPGERRESFLDIYNSGEHELVPFLGQASDDDRALVTGGRRVLAEKRAARRRASKKKKTGEGPPIGPPSGPPVGTPFVVMRFLLVDSWTIQFLFRMGFASARYTRHVLRELLTYYERVASVYLSLRQDRRGFEKIFPAGVDGYIGSYVSPILYQKRQRFGPVAKKAGRNKSSYYPPYYPARDALRDGGNTP
ncbi:BA71V-K421R [Elysia marginata]|uniref:BA71V-K421R n=1 Tax=Elysia marginata TaxID=1093978 RepID=A0AAV4GYM0_9GAST|nr:BA71V-K421R [Elysia marginata]